MERKAWSEKNGKMKEIYLTQGKSTLVDDEDFAHLNQWAWCVQKGKHTFYAMRTEKDEDKKTITIRMHRVVIGAKKGEITDHKDGDGLNNQKNNLRLCNNKENGRNALPQEGCSSRFKGVHLLRNKKNRNTYWMARITANRKLIYLGIHHSEVGAAVAYNQAARVLHGEYAKLNIIA